MTFWYTARGTYDKSYNEDGMPWDKYLDWSKLQHLTELVSLDAMLNELLVEPDHDCADDWDFIVIDNKNKFETGFYTTVDYVFKRKKANEIFNFLTVVVEPTEDCKNIVLIDFDFMGYELLDQEYGTSALTNCGGFDETFLSSDINNVGLIDNYDKAFDIKKRLLENNPQEHHADTNVIAVWRHKIIGQHK